MKNRKLVKVCGMRNPDNILEIIGLKPDFMGLVFYPGSPRFVAHPAGLSFLHALRERPVAHRLTSQYAPAPAS